ncbi:CAAX amino terminal protease self- immunity [Planctomycetes bacterium Pla163]|uniref:CAAX amino terminal protease self-immunity n=1 Tax=Rohdeia mirabilis TaxID=2528008 RepID=A0A518D1J0_9BACT|nr:CAAX amino terminal protease self- immunity [Planctomycetes bacterium Pla163]
MSADDEWEEDWEDDASQWSESSASRPGGLALGFLASAPLAVFYEWSVTTGGGALRNTAERIVSLPLDLVGIPADPVRQIALLIGTLVALAFVRRAAIEDGEPLPPRVLRVPLEGLVAALALGPALVLGQDLLGADSVPFGLERLASEPKPSLATGALVAGGAFYEELVFRVGALGLAFLAWRGIASFFGATRHLARLFGEVGGIATSALVFATFHLDAVSHWVGVSGESFDAAAFTWRFVGGCLLGAIYRWRGLGVAAWSHGLFNLTLLLGAGPGVLH